MSLSFAGWGYSSNWKMKMTDENKNEKHNSGRSDRDERDGNKQGRIAWPEKVCSALQDCGTEKPGAWFTHSGIKRRLQDMGYSNAPDSLTFILRRLVKSGHVERAIKPHGIGGEFKHGQEYLYRRTGKAFKPKTLGQGMANGTKAKDIQRGYQLRLDHPRLPKWFRDML